MTMESSGEIALIKQIESYDLLENLMQQITKDADLAGVMFICDKDISAKELIRKMYVFLFELMTADFGTYLNFLYRVDISEKTLKSMPETEPELIAKHVTLLVLKREWQKVWFRNKIQ